jgi:hypothetical protein
MPVSRVDRGLFLAVRDKAPFVLTPTLDKTEVLQGDKAVLKVKLDRRWEIKQPVQVKVMVEDGRQGSDLPNELRINNNQPISIAFNKDKKDADVGTMNVTVGPNTPPGVYNIVLRGQTQVPYNKDPKSKSKPNVFVVQPSAPISLTIVPKTLATLALNNNSPTVKIGKEVEVTVRLTRKFAYKGEFKVSLVLPKGVEGIVVPELVIPKDKDEGKLVLRIPDNTKPGFRGNLVLRAVAKFGKTEVPHETRINVNVVK